LAVVAGDATAASHRVQILYYWGHDGRNRLDTQSGTVTKDLIADGQITAALVLDSTEVARILAVADSVGFDRLPEVIHAAAVNGTQKVRDPCNKYLLRISGSNRYEAHTVIWNDCEQNPSAERDRAMALGKTIEHLVGGKEAFRKLPKARGGYL
jgi:hypothetical protein